MIMRAKVSARNIVLMVAPLALAIAVVVAVPVIADHLERRQEQLDRIRAENKKEQVADSGEKSGAMPFFEDLGIDSIVMDEAHCFPSGTLVDGKPIELIQIGDMVRSLNHDTGLIEMRIGDRRKARRRIGR